MATTITQDPYEFPKPYPGLKSLNKLVGTWELSGAEVSGRISFEWMEGGFFLLQRVDIVQGGQQFRGIQVIGYERGFQATEPSKDIKAFWYDNYGDTFMYTYEVTDEKLMIWGGDKGSPAYYEGTWSADGTANAGAWHYPGGGGYESTMTRAA